MRSCSFYFAVAQVGGELYAARKIAVSSATQALQPTPRLLERRRRGGAFDAHAGRTLRRRGRSPCRGRKCVGDVACGQLCRGAQRFVADGQAVSS